MNTSTLACRLFILTFSILANLFVSNSQVVRPYSLIYSDNIRGGHTIIGNTITAVYSSGSGSDGTINTAVMNDFSTSGTGDYSYGRTSAFGNDNSNIQFVDVDGKAPDVSLISSGSQWRYSNTNSQPSGWPNITGLPGGPGGSPFGFGPTGPVNTALIERRTYYFTKEINIDPDTFSGFTFSVTIDDGAVIYVNGTEIKRINMYPGYTGYSTDAASSAEPEETSTFSVAKGAPFVNGNNIIQVEVHKYAQYEIGTDDLYFDLELKGNGINSTANSSSADLSLPAGTNTVKFARLYWGGRITSGMGGANNINLRTAKIKFDSQNYQTIIAASGAIDKSVVNGTDSAYQAYFDVTAYINAHLNGTYTIADIKAATGSISGGGHFGGWALVIVYENTGLPYSSIRVYDGFLQVYDDGSVTSQTITLGGLNPPASFSLPGDAYMSMVSWEGDGNLAASASNLNGDFVKVNGTSVANAVNPVTNFWNGTITKNGSHLANSKNPDFKNQMSLDIDEVEVGTGFGITPSTTNVNVQFGTEADQYFPSVFAFTMKTKPPVVRLDKVVKDTASGNAQWQIPNDLLNPGEILTYTITGKNLGSGNALNCVITDTIPGSLTYRPGSLRINAPTPGVTTGFKTDARGDDVAFRETVENKTYVQFFIGAGATPSAGGLLAPMDSFSVQFQCFVPANATILNFVSNTARVTGTEQDGLTPFVDDGTAIIGPQGIGLPVKLSGFSVHWHNNAADLNWTTVSETRNDHFEIERSEDGISFIKVAEIPGNGTTTGLNAYHYIDPVNTSSKIVYYRLKIVDYDFKGYYSKLVALRQEGLLSLNNFDVYPNPFTDNLKVHLKSSKETEIKIRMNNAIGQMESSWIVNIQPGENIVVLTNLDSIKAGIYFMEIMFEGEKVTQKVIKR